MGEEKENMASRNTGDHQCADAGPCPHSPDVRENWVFTDEFGQATPGEVEQAIAILSMNNGDLAYKIQACFAIGGAFAAPSDGDGELAACAREAGWALSENVDRLPWERRGRISAIIQKLGAALIEHETQRDGGEAVHEQVRQPSWDELSRALQASEARANRAEEALRGVLEIPDIVKMLEYHRRGIGTKSAPGLRLQAALDALNPDKEA